MFSKIHTQRNSYRCGVFFAGDNINDDPRFKIFIIPKRFGTDCGRNKAAIQAEVKKECTDLVISSFIFDNSAFFNWFFFSSKSS